MNDARITELLRRVESDAPFAGDEHARLRSAVLAHFDRVRLAGDESESATVAEAIEVERSLEVAPDAMDAVPRRRRWGLMGVAASAVVAVGAVAVWATTGDRGPEQSIVAEEAPTTTDIAIEPFGPVGTMLRYEVARDGVAQGTLELEVEAVDTVDPERERTMLNAAFSAPGDDRTRAFGVVSFEVSDEQWTVPLSLGRLSGTTWPECGDAAVEVPRGGTNTSVATLECDGMPVSVTVATDTSGSALEALISLTTADDDHEMRVVADANGRLERMVIELSTTADLIETTD